MLSNTKLGKFDKEILRAMKDENPKITLSNNMETTIAFKESINTVEFALSVMSPNEKKFRRKVGEYWAMIRFNEGVTVKMAKHDFYVLMGELGL